MPKPFFFLVVLFVASSLTAKSSVDMKKEFAEFIQKYQKHYATAEEYAHRLQVFAQNYHYVMEFNRNQSKLSFSPARMTLAMNSFGDLTASEFAAHRQKTRVTPLSSSTLHFSPSAPLPTSWDWRPRAVTAVQNQGQCGGVWAFPAVGAVEGCHYVTMGTLVALSVQQILDCSTPFGNEGCDGGLMENAFEYLLSAQGLDTEACYPYEGYDDESCEYKASCCASAVKNYTEVPSGSEAALQVAVYMVPTSAGIDASHSSFQMYSGGVYYEPDCSATELDSGVLVVGWGVLDNQEYWIAKNSWGTEWGLEGYILMSRNRENNCGIASMASYVQDCPNC